MTEEKASPLETVSNAPTGLLDRATGAILWATNMQRNEFRAALTSFLFVFTLMAAYYLVRPVRDAMASDWSDAEVSWLWTLNFFISTALVALYGWVVSRVPFHRIVPSVYLFFSATFVLFYMVQQTILDAVLIDKVFYLWVSVFALFHVSVFWSFMADTFNRQQAGRLFSLIAAGASLGAIAGPLASAILVEQIGIRALMLVAGVMLLIPLPMIFYLNRQKVTALDNAALAVDTEQLKLGGNPFAGFRDFVTNPYLLGIGVFIILYTAIGSFVYFEQKNLLADFSRPQRVEILGVRDFLINVVTFAMAFFLTGRIVSKLGMPTALTLVPVLIVIGMLVLAFSPVLIVALGLWGVRSAGNYGLARPAREMLFTQVDREARFKAKPVIDIVAYRGGDVVTAWFFTFLTATLEFSLAAVAVVGAGIAALWGVTGLYLGRAYDRSRGAQD